MLELEYQCASKGSRVSVLTRPFSQGKCSSYSPLQIIRIQIVHPIQQPNLMEWIKSQKVDPWTMKQAYFAVYGGVAIDSSSFSDGERLKPISTRISTLAGYGLLP